MLVAQSPFSGCDEDALFWSIRNEIPWYPFYLSDDALNILGKVSVAWKSTVFTLLLLMEIELTFKSFGISTPHRITAPHHTKSNQTNANRQRKNNKQLLDKNANTRLGSPSSPHGEINQHIFFHEIDWKKLERRQLESPFKPNIVSEIHHNIIITMEIYSCFAFFPCVCAYCVVLVDGHGTPPSTILRVSHIDTYLCLLCV